eukprot:3935465-Rhodomonas_salina.1
MPDIKAVSFASRRLFLLAPCVSASSCDAPADTATRGHSRSPRVLLVNAECVALRGLQFLMYSEEGAAGPAPVAVSPSLVRVTGQRFTC